MRLKLGLVVVVGVQVGGRALPTIFPMRYTTQSGALAGCRQALSPTTSFLSLFRFLPFRSTFLPVSKPPCQPSFLSCFPSPHLLFFSFPVSFLWKAAFRHRWHLNGTQSSSPLPSYHSALRLDPETSVQGLR